MKEMEELAKALKKCNSFKDRKEYLNKSLDNMSFKYPEIYPLLFREIKKRELEFNDPNKIAEWLNTSNPDSYVKLHEALMFVKHRNFMAKDKYINNLKQVLYHTIENKINLEEAMKICCLIERSPHLKTIKEHLQSFIPQINQLYQHYNNRGNMWMNEINQAQFVDSFGRMSIQYTPDNQSQHLSTLVQPINLKATQGVPYFNLEFFGYDHLEMTATSNRQCYTTVFGGTQSNPTIIGQEMDGAVAKWLHYLKLHKYQWFFNDLSYFEIEYIDEDNIDKFIMKVNLNTIKRGAKKKICISTKTLRDRSQKFKDILMALDLDVTHNELCEFITYMCDILHYPIPNKNCVVGNQIQQDIVMVMSKLLYNILEKLCASKSVAAHSLLGASINKYLECSLLITENEMFMQDQVKNVFVFIETLSNRVNLFHK